MSDEIALTQIELLERLDARHDIFIRRLDEAVAMGPSRYNLKEFIAADGSINCPSRVAARTFLETWSGIAVAALLTTVYERTED